MTARFEALVALAIPALAGCSTVEQRTLSAGDAAQWFPALFAAAPSREDLLLQFGAPSAVFEDGRIFTWRFARRDGMAVAAAPEAGTGPDEPSPWTRASLSLVVVFDGAGIVRRHALIAVR